MNSLLEAEIHGYDIDMTLVDSRPVIGAAFRDYAMQNYGIELPDEFIPHILPGTPEEMIATFGKHLREHHGRDLKGEPKDDIPKWKEAYMACDEEPVVFSGTVEMLALSKDLGAKVTLITSAMNMEVDKNTAAIMRAARENGYDGELWDSIVAYEDVERHGKEDLGKPHVHSMELALQRMGLAPNLSEHSSFYVGDSTGDMHFARNIGGTGVFLETRFPASELSFEGISPLVFRDICHLYKELNT